MAYKQVSCYDCGLLLPANEATKRRIISGASSGSSINYNHPDQTRFSSRAYYQDAYMCKKCAALIDKEEADDRRSFWIWTFGIIFAIIFGFFYLVSNHPSNTPRPSQQVSSPSRGNGNINMICAIREWDGRCSQWVWK